MKLLFIGDVVGRAVRDAVTKHLPGLRARLGLDFVVANGENAAHGFGITPGTARELYDAGVDCITTGLPFSLENDFAPVNHYVDESAGGNPRKGYFTGFTSRSMIIQTLRSSFSKSSEIR